ncbi:MAG: hypothetical protein ACKOXM_07970 [Agromyces sp.]
MNGNILTQIVDHTSRQYSYPVVADPAWGAKGKNCSRFSGLRESLRPSCLPNRYTGIEAREAEERCMRNAFATGVISSFGGWVAVVSKTPVTAAGAVAAGSVVVLGTYLYCTLFKE